MLNLKNTFRGLFLLVGFFMCTSLAIAAVTGIAEFGEGGTGNGQFNFDNTGIAIDSSGNIYVADGGNNRIQKFDSSGNYITQWGSIGTGNGEMTEPDAVAIDSSGDVWVLDNNRVQKFSNTGTFIASYNGTDQGGASFLHYDHIAIDGDDNVYVGNGGGIIQVYNSSMTYIEAFDGDDKGGDTFTSITGMEFDAANNLYVNTNGKIQTFDDNNDFITSWIGAGNGGLGVTPDGTVYTSQSTDTQIRKYQSDGTFIESFSCFGSGITCLSGPSDIDFFGQNVYVAEQGPSYSSDRINIFTDTGIIVDPAVSTFSPADNATDVATNSNLVITFNKAVDAETGNITLKKSSDDTTVETFDVTSDISGSGSTEITINPSSDLDEQTEYYVQIDATAFDDADGNSFDGISDTTTWSFTTADETNPVVATLSPADNATDVSLSANLVITFSEAVDAESGNITLKKSSDNTTIETFDVTSDISGSGTTEVTVNPTDDLSYGTEYYVQIDATAFDDSAGNSFAGISDTTTWSFATLSDPTQSSEPTTTGGGIVFGCKDENASNYNYFSSHKQELCKYSAEPVATTQTATLSDIVEQYRDVFLRLYDAGIELPIEVTDILGVEMETPSQPITVRDLELGMEGADVRLLQNLLMTAGYSIPAGSTGYFGIQTQYALDLYQADNSIAPRGGYFGPITRTQMTSAGVSGLWW